MTATAEPDDAVLLTGEEHKPSSPGSRRKRSTPPSSASAISPLCRQFIGRLDRRLPREMAHHEFLAPPRRLRPRLRPLLPRLQIHRRPSTPSRNGMITSRRVVYQHLVVCIWHTPLEYLKIILA